MSKWTVEVCQKKDLYNTIINAFKAKGWEDIASAPASEFNVLRSYDSQNRPIFIRFRPFTATNTTHNVITTDRTAFTLGVAKNYVPNATPGTAGVFTLSSTIDTAFTGSNATTTSTQIPLDADNIRLYHNITNTRGYFAVRFNRNFAFATTYGSVFFVGVPDDEFMDDNPRRAAICLGPIVSTLAGIDFPVQFTATESTVVVNYNMALWTSPRTPDLERKFWVSPVFYTHASVGIRGRLSELIYMPPSAFILDGDILNIGGINYELLRISTFTGTFANDSFVCLEV